ncbi:MAG: hypothetical protein ACE145_05400 [Terriglobia bacterium]
MRLGMRVLISCILLASMAAVSARAQEPSTQDQPAPDQSKTEQKKEKKKGGGFFGGLKAVAGTGSEQQEATRTAGSKTVGEGAQIGDAQPTAADRQAVSAMESYSVPAPEVKKFQDDGKLKSK